MRGNQEAASGAGGTVTIDAEGRVTQTAAPVKVEDDEARDAELLKAYSEAWKRVAGKEVDFQTQILINATTDPAERMRLLEQAGVKDAEAASQIMGLIQGVIGRRKTATPAAGAANPAAGAAAVTAPAGVTSASGIDRFRRR
jgi:hypothetical protein